MINKNTLVIGASLKPERYSNKAIRMLVEYGVKTQAIGLRNGVVAGIKVGKAVLGSNEVLSKRHNSKLYNNLHTVTLYLNAKRQIDYYEFIVDLKPKRVIFNPGTENEDFYKILKKNTINYEVACTLVLLRMKAF
jgi:predicted CoA-binding protein